MIFFHTCYCLWKKEDLEKKSEKSVGCINLLNQNIYRNAFKIFSINLLSFFKMLVCNYLREDQIYRYKVS